MPTVKDLNQKRADYERDVWQVYEWLHEGGHAIAKAKQLFLPRRPLEEPEFYQVRLQGFSYKNLASAIVSDLSATTLQAPLEVQRKKQGAQRPPADPFYAEFLEDPTGKGRSAEEGGDLNQFASACLERAMVKRDAWVYIGFPSRAVGASGASSRAEQEAAGDLRVMLSHVRPESVFNVLEDERGLSEAILFERKCPQTLAGNAEDAKDTLIWTKLTRKEVITYELIVDRGESPRDDQVVPEASRVTHRLAGFDGLGALPLRRLHLPKSLWVLDKIGSLCEEELRKRNGLGWYMDCCCYPQPYYKGDENLREAKAEDREQNKRRGVLQVLELEREGEYGYAEPSGSTLEFGMNFLIQLERDIYKSLHEMAAAQGPNAAAQIQSAASKVRDSVAKNILAGKYAKRVRNFVHEVMTLSAAARDDTDHIWVVSGADQHDLIDEEEAIGTALRVQGVMDLQKSPTGRKALVKRVWRSLLRGEPAEIFDEIDRETETANFIPPDEDAGDPEDQ